jgi:CheY-like chemotaxis protein
LAFSRRQVLKPARVNLNAVVSEMSDMLKRVFGELVTLETSLDPELSDAILDPGQTEQVFMNLALNAHESMPEGGVLRIETENTTRSPPGEDAASMPMIVLRIADTGCGMSEDAKTRIFDPFFSTKSHGTGLGLAVVHGIVKQHNGWIEVDSIEGEGTTFTVYLPAIPSQTAPAESTHSDSAMIRGRGERILVVEDEQIVRKFAEKLLHRAGYEVCVAETGEEAMRIIEADGDHLGLVFSDVVLPGMSGLEVANRVRERLPNVPVLLASGYSERLATKGGAEPLDFPFIDKPYEATALLKTLRDLLGA